MIKIILCEGKTDAILIRYFLGAVCNWKHVNKGPKEFNMKTDSSRTEFSSWYNFEDDYLLICGVGGTSNFEHFYETKIANALVDTDIIEKIAIVTDRDDRLEEDIISDFTKILEPLNIKVENNQWTNNSFIDSYGNNKTLDFLLLIIPSNKEGALESVLLDAIAEDPYDKNIVDRSCSFVDEIKDIAEKYISKRRMQLKAKLGVTWAIQSPNKDFDFFDEQIKDVDWNNSQVIKECFGELIKI